jgi:hypothetical protein
MTYNIAAQAPDIRLTFELQKKAALWVYRVTSQQLTRERVKVELGKIEDEAEREELREWLRHYDAIAKVAAAAARKNKRSRYVAR